MSKVRIEPPGLLTTVQDLGRFGYQRFGVPVAGVFDRFSARVANWLVGNAATAAVLEITLLGPTLRTTCLLQAAVCGGEAECWLDGEPVELWQSFLWRPGQTLQIGSLRRGARAYLAVSGGWQVAAVMGSRSTYLRAGIGGYEGRQLKAGDEIAVESLRETPPERRLPRAFWPELPGKVRLRYVAGPETDHFSAEARLLFRQSEYLIAPASDRMGVRLTGPAVKPLTPDIISNAIAYGSIQVPRDGQPIIMGPDRQTTGGYPKIGTVVSADLSRLAQAKPGDTVSWEEVSVASAQQLAAASEAYAEQVRRVIDGSLRGREYRVRLGDAEYYTFVEKADTL
ncbi:MAG: biotin-dependent carboxyltransferase family protein [Bacillota bacterium]|jgi:antagonist of KipI